MKKENHWRCGTGSFVSAPLPGNLKGHRGCLLHRVTFDAAIGEEICAVYMEEPEFAASFSKVDPFNLFARTGLVRTPYGLVAFILWQIAAHSPQEVMVEQYLNPHDIETIYLVGSAANQTHFKFVVVNNETAETAAFVEFENMFEFGRLVSRMALAIGHERSGDVAAAQQHVMETMTLPELFSAAQGLEPQRAQWQQ